MLSKVALAFSFQQSTSWTAPRECSRLERRFLAKESAEDITEALCSAADLCGGVDFEKELSKKPEVQMMGGNFGGDDDNDDDGDGGGDDEF